MKKTTLSARVIHWGLTAKLEDLDFADNLVLISNTETQMHVKTQDSKSMWTEQKLCAKTANLMPRSPSVIHKLGLDKDKTQTLQFCSKRNPDVRK